MDLNVNGIHPPAIGGSVRVVKLTVQRHCVGEAVWKALGFFSRDLRAQMCSCKNGIEVVEQSRRKEFGLEWATKPFMWQVPGRSPLVCQSDEAIMASAERKLLGRVQPISSWSCSPALRDESCFRLFVTCMMMSPSCVWRVSVRGEIPMEPFWLAADNRGLVGHHLFHLIFRDGRKQRPPALSVGHQILDPVV